MGKIRLYVDHPLGAGKAVPLDRDRAHYLFSVMRLSVGAQLAVFNGQDGEWTANVAKVAKRDGVLEAVYRSAPQRDPPDLWLLFAPLKKARTDFAVEKAVELGAARIVPVLTEFTNAERVRRDRLQTHAVEAAEQCGATYVPEVADAVKLGGLLDGWDATRRLVFCDEALAGQGADLTGVAAPAAILVGPEGGLSEAERARLHALPFAQPVSLGPRILRAETAVLAALTLWQTAAGDWR